MTTATVVQQPTPYEHRLNLVAGVLSSHPALKGGDVNELATRVLYAIDHIPERTRR